MTNKYLIFRILGNKIENRTDNYLSCLELLLENEPNFEFTEKIWLLNRIFDKELLREIIDILNKYNHKYLLIDFNIDEYMRIDQKYKLKSKIDNYIPLLKDTNIKHIYKMLSNYNKIQYIMNINNARNYALEYGKKKSEWTFVFDGFCFLNNSLWESIIRNINDNDRYLIIDMIRLKNNKDLSISYDILNNYEKSEPQIGFHKNSELIFNDNIMYGRMDKVELLIHIGLKGIWDTWKTYDVEKEMYIFRKKSYKSYKKTGIVLRLDTTNNENYLTSQIRTQLRREGIYNIIKNIDNQTQWSNRNSNNYIVYNPILLENNGQISELLNNIHKNIIELAKYYINIDIPNILTKKLIAESGDKQDYFTIAPYFYERNGKYIHNDCIINPATKLYNSENLYDRTNFQLFLDQTIIQCIAYKITNNNIFGNKAYNNIKIWFINKNTQMNPNMKYAQCYGYLGTGIIETKDLYYLLDGIKMIISFFTMDELNKLKEWFSEYLNWLLTDKSGKKELSTKNNHRTAIYLQIISISFFLNNIEILHEYCLKTMDLIDIQLTSDGNQIYERNRPDLLHYYEFNLQLLITLLEIVRNIYPYMDQLSNKKLELSMKYLVDYRNNIVQLTTSKQIYSKDEYKLRILPILIKYNMIHSNKNLLEYQDEILRNQIYYPHFGITPYWILTY